MVELTIKTESEILEKFKSLSRQVYQGDDTTAFREAVVALTSLQQKRDSTRLKTLIEKLQSDIKSRGGLSDAQIDQLVRESRMRRRAASR